MDEADTDSLFEFAELVLAVGRQLRTGPVQAADRCTPLESTVMRFIDQHPGTSARAAGEATLLASSNFSRALRGLEQRGFVRREIDSRDGRGVRLYPTDLAQQNLAQLRAAYRQTLAGIVPEPATLDAVNATLRQVEDELVERRRRTGDRGAA